MFVPFLYELRAARVPVGTQEAVALAEALARGLHDASLDGFYDVARALLVHSERHLDAFDTAFLKHFKGVEAKAQQIHAELLEWLKEARRRRAELSPEELALLEALDRESLEKLFEERLREQKERHDGGNRWIGTGGSSPFGHSGAARDGIRVGGDGGNRRALRVAGERQFAAYRDDLVLDVRQIAVALRKLRAFSRDGADTELDLDETIEKTAQNLGEIEVVTRPPRRSNTRVILLLDVGGSMDPHSYMVSLLFSAAKQAAHFRELRTYYFHNAVYGRVFHDAQLRRPLEIHELRTQCDGRYKLVCVGDAMMAPWELLERSGWSPGGKEALAWFHDLAEAYPSHAWLNPEPPVSWDHTTVSMIRRAITMFPLTLEGISEAVTHLIRRPC